MTRILHIITSRNVPLATVVVAAQEKLSDCEVKSVDWTGAEPNLVELLDEIFKADSIQTW